MYFYISTFFSLIVYDVSTGWFSRNALHWRGHTVSWSCGTVIYLIERCYMTGGIVHLACDLRVAVWYLVCRRQTIDVHSLCR